MTCDRSLSQEALACCPWALRFFHRLHASIKRVELGHSAEQRASPLTASCTPVGRNSKRSSSLIQKLCAGSVTGYRKLGSTSSKSIVKRSIPGALARNHLPQTAAHTQQLYLVQRHPQDRKARPKVRKAKGTCLCSIGQKSKVRSTGSEPACSLHTPSCVSLRHTLPQRCESRSKLCQSLQTSSQCSAVLKSSSLNISSNSSSASCGRCRPDMCHRKPVYRQHF